uniref:Uncharacterized protein n=1 Tax=Pristionchus pacificus TaxID=54126 RepID=A0A2A6CYG2_PRIPA|eukprot:PDM83107.1 hypothetical protein PRIPAC_37500 [Pristionchus pacificus]
MKSETSVLPIVIDYASLTISTTSSAKHQHVAHSFTGLSNRKVLQSSPSSSPPMSVPC